MEIRPHRSKRKGRQWGYFDVLPRNMGWARQGLVRGESHAVIRLERTDRKNNDDGLVVRVRLRELRRLVTLGEEFELRWTPRNAARRHSEPTTTQRLVALVERARDGRDEEIPEDAAWLREADELLAELRGEPSGDS